MSSHPQWLKTNSSLLLSRKAFPLSYSQRIQRKLSNKRSDSARRHEPHSFAQSFARVHGPTVCAFAIREKDAAYALTQAVLLGAKTYHGRVGPMELNIPGIRGIGGSLIYLVDRFGDRSIYDVDFAPAGKALRKVHGVGLTHIDHLTHNVHKVRMDQWELRLRLQDSKKVAWRDVSEICEPETRNSQTKKPETAFL
jgi:hypothetical protein